MLVSFIVDDDSLKEAIEILEETREEYPLEDIPQFLVETMMLNVIMCNEVGMSQGDIKQCLNNAYGAVAEYYYEKQNNTTVH